MPSIPFVAVRRLAVLVSIGVSISSSLTAQSTGTIRGRVTDAASQRPIADAQVTVVGTGGGAVTNTNGDYVIANVPAGSYQVNARRIGYSRKSANVTVNAGAEVRLDITLSQAASQLEAIVVTGTAGAQEKRSIGNAVTQIQAADVVSKSTVTNVSELLQAKAPGVAVMSNSGTPGTASDIVIRGYGSLTTNKPVVYIDGIRMDTENLGNFGPSGAGTTQFSGQTTSALDQINPQDIESIEVLKGPAAATLYGADAASGVIQIITKKGRRGQQPVRWTMRGETGWNEWGVKTLTNYTMCTTARAALADAAGNPTWPGCKGLPDSTVITGDPLASDPLALRNGTVRNVSLSLRGGGDRYSYYISADGVHNLGIHYNSNDDRRSARTNFTFNPSNAIDFNVNVSFNRDRLRLPLGDEAANGLLLSGARGIPGLAKTVARQQQYGWGTIDPDQANRYDNETASDRFFLGTTVNYQPFNWFRNRLTAGMDYRSTFANILSLPGDPDTPAGLNAQRVPRVYNYTFDYVGSAIARFMNNFESTTSVGSQITSRKEETISATGTSLPTREITIIGAALSVSGANSFSEFNSVGVYGQEQVAYRNRIFLTGALRADDHSSFGTQFDWIVYPKASLSWVVSEEPGLRSYFDKIHSNNFRLRGAWGMAGRAPAPYLANETYSSARVAVGTSGVGGALRSSSFGNPNLKPEKGQEVELGFDSDYFGGRAGFELTYYTKTMRDLLVPLALPPSLGFPGSMQQNIGKTNNKGVEISLSGTPIDRRNVQWEGRVNLAWNRNRLLYIDSVKAAIAGPNGPYAEDIPGSASYSPSMQRNRVGYPLGAWFLRYPTLDANGNYTFTQSATGAFIPVYDTAFKFLGPAVPTKLASFSSTVTLFKNWRLYGLVDFQGGHYQFNYKEFNRCALVSNGPNCERLNQKGLTPQYRALWGYGAGSTTVVTTPMTQTLYVEKADFTKLRDLSLSFLVPDRWARLARMESANIVLSGHNLATWTGYSGLDPEVTGYGNNTVRGGAAASQFVRVDAYSMPQTRRYSLQLNVTY